MSEEKTSIQKREAESIATTERTRSERVYIPAVDIYETSDDIILLADMPGVDEKSLDITLENMVLRIRGRVSRYQPQDYDLSYSEYEEGDYERSFTLTDTIDQNKIEANFKNGVLRLRLPKAEPAKPRKIEVKYQ
ncbi:MAG: Hsp20/alpha crystallin family protein [Calditrichia bacterium]